MGNLHEFQEKSVLRALGLPRPLKYFELSETGLGKSVIALEIIRRLGCTRVLVVTLASVKHGWLERAAEWAPHLRASSITMGRGRKGLSKPAAARLEAAYSADLQVVSYDLVDEVDLTGWHAIVVDEGHDLVSYRSKTAKRLRELFAANPDAHKLLLTATAVTSEPKNTWTLLNLFWPERFGEATKQGEPPYRFLNAFCNKHEVEWDGGRAIAYKGLNPANADKFAKLIMANASRTLRTEVPELLPALDVRPLVIEASDKRPGTAHVTEWATTAAREAPRIGIFTHFRATAEKYAETLQALPRFADFKVIVMHGEMPADRRARALAALREEERVILVATMHALGTGITLTWVKQYLIAELVAAPYKLVQLLGRFSRLDADGQVGCFGRILIREGDARIPDLLRRIKDEDILQRNGANETAILQAVDAGTKQNFDAWLDDLAGTFRDYAEGVDDDDE